MALQITNAGGHVMRITISITKTYGAVAKVLFPDGTKENYNLDIGFSEKAMNKPGFFLGLANEVARNAARARDLNGAAVVGFYEDSTFYYIFTSGPIQSS